MKKILVLIIVLFTAIVTMAYLYFSGLNAEQQNSESSLHAAAANSAFVFSFENDKSILDILKGQDLFQEIMGSEKYEQLLSLKKYILQIQGINRFVDKQLVYVSLIPGANKEIDFLYCTQVNSGTSSLQLLSALKANGIGVEVAQNLSKLVMSDSSIFYLGIKNNLVLLSNAAKPVSLAMSADPDKENKFTEYIKANSRLSKNSLAEVYINFSHFPELLKTVMPGKLSGELAFLASQNSFASLVYNFSKEKILLTGITTTNDPKNYHQLFAGMQAQKITITNILPESTATYAVYAIDNYKSWQDKLDGWFKNNMEEQLISKLIDNNNKKYHINLNQIFPKYFKNQFINFQLSTTEKLGAIALDNGDKVLQLLLDLSTEYSTDVKLLKEDNLLYAYFGEPFKKFKRPYYTIIDNYMVFANNASTIQSFLNSYKNNRLLINDTEYTNTINQLTNNANISFFANFKNAQDIFRNNLYLPFYKQFRDEKGLKNYTAFTYQMSGDNGKFQTNVLLNKKQSVMPLDSLPLTVDSLNTAPQR